MPDAPDGRGPLPRTTGRTFAHRTSIGENCDVGEGAPLPILAGDVRPLIVVGIDDTEPVVRRRVLHYLPDATVPRYDPATLVLTS